MWSFKLVNVEFKTIGQFGVFFGVFHISLKLMWSFKLANVEFRTPVRVQSISQMLVAQPGRESEQVAAATAADLGLVWLSRSH